MKNIKRLIFSALLLLALSSPLAAAYYDFENHMYYQAYVAGKGWQPWVGQREVAGLPGEARPICAIRIITDTSSAIDAGVYYRVHLTRYVTRQDWPATWRLREVATWEGWTPWAWSGSGDIAGMTKSDGSIDETKVIDGMEIMANNPVPEYAIGLATYRKPDGWIVAPKGAPPVHIFVDYAYSKYTTYKIYGFSINVWGEGPEYPTL